MKTGQGRWHNHADPPHVVMVLGDDAAEGELVTGSGRRDEIRPMSFSQPRHGLHAQQMRDLGLVCQAMATSRLHGCHGT